MDIIIFYFFNTYTWPHHYFLKTSFHQLAKASIRLFQPSRGKLLPSQPPHRNRSPCRRVQTTDHHNMQQSRD